MDGVEFNFSVEGGMLFTNSGWVDMVGFEFIF